MKTFELSAKRRETLGKKISKELRLQESIPAVMYGGKDNMALTLTQAGVRKLIYSPEIFLINLDIEGDKRTCILQEIQFHPVTDQIIHIDLLEVFPQKPIVIEVPVQLEGHAIGVRAGGKLSLDMRRLKVKGLYENIPEKLVIDVTKLGLGKTVQVGQLKYDNIEILNAKNAVVAAVRLTRAARGAAANAAALSMEEEEESEETTQE